MYIHICSSFTDTMNIKSIIPYYMKVFTEYILICNNIWVDTLIFCYQKVSVQNIVRLIFLILCDTLHMGIQKIGFGVRIISNSQNTKSIIKTSFKCLCFRSLTSETSAKNNKNSTLQYIIEKWHQYYLLWVSQQIFLLDTVSYHRKCLYSKQGIK